MMELKKAQIMAYKSYVYQKMGDIENAIKVNNVNYR
jgi:hypothetical protein